MRRCLVPRVRHTLDELPETLDETYERTLLDIDKKRWAYAHRLFQCLVVALRPLHVEELADFLAFEFKDEENPIFRADCRHEDPTDAVLSTCSSLISIINVQFGPAIVQFSHFSVKEYLTAARIVQGRVPRYYISLEPAHILVTRACLSILLQLDGQITEERKKDLPLVKYAAWHWVRHAKFKNALSQTEKMVKRLFDALRISTVTWYGSYLRVISVQVLIMTQFRQPYPLQRHELEIKMAFESTFVSATHLHDLIARVCLYTILL